MSFRLLPFLEWFRGYEARSLKRDAAAGLSVALVLIPQSMAYAQLAGLPAHYGLYASLLPPLAAALFGSSRQLATGPVAVVSLMTAASLAPMAAAGSAGYIAYAMLLAAMVGAIQLLLGVLRLGMVINLLSHPVINGFSNAAALIIATSQIPSLLGIQTEPAQYHYQTVARMLEAAARCTHWPTLLMGLTGFAVMLLARKLNSRVPGVLAAVVVTTLLSWALGFEDNLRVALSAVSCPRGGAVIRQFNAAVGAVPPLIANRAARHAEMARAGKAGDTIAMLDARRDVDVMSIKIERLNYDAALYRERLRRMRFVRETGPDGGDRFVSAGRPPSPDAGDARLWRIRVGSEPLDPRGIVFAAGGEVIGAIPGGLPSIRVPRLDWNAAGHLLPFAGIVALLGFMESISIARAMAAKTGQRLDPNQELIGQGLGNIAGALSGSYPVSGSFSRSAVNLEAGAVTGMSSVFSSLAVLVLLLCLTPLLHHLPRSVLAAVIMLAVVGLINVGGFVHAWRAQRHDGIIAVVTFVCTLAFAPHLEKGILIGAGLSLSVFLYRSMRPAMVSLSLSPDRRLHDAMAYGLRECRFIDVVRFEGPLFFANSSYLEEQIAQHRLNKKELKHIILVAGGINDIDASGQETLSLVVDRVRSAGIDFSISGANETVTAKLRHTHLLAKIGSDHIYPDLDAAIRAVHRRTHKEGQEASCPLTTVVYRTPAPRPSGEAPAFSP